MHHDGSTEEPLLGSKFVLDEKSKMEAKSHGERTVTLYSRPDMPADAWFDELSPHLSQQAAVAYQHVDPVNIQTAKITGSAQLTPESSPLMARVSVPTDAGVYLIILSRSEGSPEWRTERILLPEAAS